MLRPDDEGARRYGWRRGLDDNGEFEDGRGECRVTRAVVEAGKLLNIDVLDHLVIGHQRFVSMKERGLGF